MTKDFMALMSFHFLCMAVALMFLLPSCRGAGSVPGNRQDLTGEDRVRLTESKMKQLVFFIQSAFSPMHGYPQSLASIPSLSSKRIGEDGASSLLQDAWKRDFLYRTKESGAGFSLLSFGEDGMEGGDGFAEDLLLEQSFFSRKQEKAL